MPMLAASPYSSRQEHRARASPSRPRVPHQPPASRHFEDQSRRETGEPSNLQRSSLLTLLLEQVWVKPGRTANPWPQGSPSVSLQNQHPQLHNQSSKLHEELRESPRSHLNSSGKPPMSLDPRILADEGFVKQYLGIQTLTPASQLVSLRLRLNRP